MDPNYKQLYLNALAQIHKMSIKIDILDQNIKEIEIKQAKEIKKLQELLLDAEVKLKYFWAPLEGKKLDAHLISKGFHITKVTPREILEG